MLQRAYKLRGSVTQLHSHPEEDWSIQSKHWQNKFLCYQVIYKKTATFQHRISILTPDHIKWAVHPTTQCTNQGCGWKSPKVHSKGIQCAGISSRRTRPFPAHQSPVNFSIQPHKDTGHWSSLAAHKRGQNFSEASTFPEQAQPIHSSGPGPQRQWPPGA